jgi:hypothetical protein
VVDCETARVILEPYFKAAQEEFVRFEREHYGGKKVSYVRLECASWAELQQEEGFDVRNFAGTSEDGRLIIAAPELVELPEESVAAIVAHELGHAFDYLYPARFVVARGELLRFDDLDAEDKASRQARIARMQQWERRDRDVVEGTADEIASLVLKREIRYAGPCLLQTFGRGISRPEGLR